MTLIVVISLGGLILLSLAIRQLGEYARRNFLGRDRERLFQQAFPDFCYQPFAGPHDIAGLSDFPEICRKFESTLGTLFLGGRSEIYNLISDVQGSQERSIFDLRTISRGLGPSRSRVHTSTVFLIYLPSHKLTVFRLVRESFGHINLWGEDADIDIDGEFVFSQNFHLTGPDRDAVIRRFDKSLVSFFRTHTTLFAAGTLDVTENAILFTHTLPLDPEDIRSILETLSKLILLLTAEPR